MRIDRLTAIEFGKLKDKTVRFSDGLNIVTAPNESGKSTLAALIRFLLYGFANQRRTERTPVPAREKYTPWSGSVPAGSMEYFEDAKSYTLSRAVKGNSTQLNLYDTLTATPITLRGEPGEELFGVSAETYESTAFFGYSSLGVMTMGEIESKLRNIATGADEESSYENAKKRLTQARNKIDNGYFNSRINQVRGELERLQGELEQAYLENERYDVLKDERLRLEEQIRKIEAVRDETAGRLKLLKASLEGRCAARRREILSKKEDLDGRLRQLEELLKKVSRDELDDYTETLYRYNALKQMIGRPPLFPVKRFLPGMGAGRRAAMICLAAAPLLLALAGGVLALHLKQTALSVVLLCFFAVISAAYPFYIKRRRILLAQYDAQMEEYSQKREELKACGVRLAEFFGTFGEGDDDAWEIRLAGLRGMLKDFDSLDAQARALAGEYEGMIPERFFAQSGEYNELTRRLIRIEDNLNALKIEAAGAAVRESAFAEQFKGPDLIQSRINEVSQRLAQMQDRLNACNRALEALGTAHTDMARLFAPLINERADANFADITGPPQRGIAIDTEGNLRISQAGSIRPLAYFSASTADAAYIALRLALIELLYATSPPPLVFDDAFLSFDPDRLAAMMELLFRLSQRYQIILFSCRDLKPALGGARCNDIVL